MKVLIIEDEFEIRELISSFLRGEGFVVEEADTFCEACEKVNLYEYDCVIVDITLPDGNGLDLITELKQHTSDTCIIVVSARNSTEDKIRGLDIGADDYLSKPFELAELNARIKSVMRRKRFAGHADVIFNELRILPDSRQLFVNKTEITLTPKEYDLIIYFVMNKNRVLTKENIVEHLWGDMMGITADSFDFIYTHIRNLRQKLIKAGGNDYIKTVYSVGYKFTD